MGLPDKGCAIKGLVVCNVVWLGIMEEMARVFGLGPDKGRAINVLVVCNLEPLDLLYGLALDCDQLSPEV